MHHPQNATSGNLHSKVIPSSWMNIELMIGHGGKEAESHKGNVGGKILSGSARVAVGGRVTEGPTEVAWIGEVHRTHRSGYKGKRYRFKVLHRARKLC